MIRIHVSPSSIPAEERDQVEIAVRGAFGARPLSESWDVRVLRVQSLWPLWAVSIDGPGVRTRHFVTPQDRLVEAVRRALPARPAETAKGSAAIA